MDGLLTLPGTGPGAQGGHCQSLASHFRWKKHSEAPPPPPVCSAQIVNHKAEDVSGCIQQITQEIIDHVEGV